MKTQIRRGLFETNSSSVHAIVICRDTRPLKVATDSFPKNITFSCDEFAGWDHEVFNDYQAKADYLYTCMVCMAEDNKHYLNSWKYQIMSYLALWNIECKFNKESERYATLPHLNFDYILNFIKFIMKDEIHLLDYLFNPKSFFEKGNDNEDCNFDFENVSDGISKDRWVVYKKVF